MIEQGGRRLFFHNVWSCCADIFENLPADAGRLRLVIETDTGHRLVTVPMETEDAPFIETVVNGVSNLAAAKSSMAAAMEKNRTV